MGLPGVRTLAPLLAIAAAMLIYTPVAIAQVVTATLTGTVTDSSGATVPGATVTATETSTGTSRSTQTSAEGVYTLPFLPPRNLQGGYREDRFQNGHRTQFSAQCFVGRPGERDLDARQPDGNRASYRASAAVASGKRRRLEGNGCYLSGGTAHAESQRAGYGGPGGGRDCAGALQLRQRHFGKQRARIPV